MSAETCKRCEGRGTEPRGLQCNDGTEACPTCLSAASGSTLKAVADLRAKLAAAEARTEKLKTLLRAVVARVALTDEASTSTGYAIAREVWGVIGDALEKP